MGIEFERVTTRGGDSGESGLFSGERRRKDDVLFQTLGDGDELVSTLGVARARASRVAKAGESADRVAALGYCAESILSVQKDVFRVQAMIATSPGSQQYESLELVEEATVTSLEQRLSGLMERTEIGERFVVPGDSLLSAHIDVARTVCRRFERGIVSCIRDRRLHHLIPCQQYVNRLSDFLFVLGRYVDQTG